jgi:hypothetical protein
MHRFAERGSATATTTTHYADASQRPHDAAVVFALFLVFAALDSLEAFLPFLAALATQVGEQHAAAAALAQQAAGDQRAHEAVSTLTARLLKFFPFVLDVALLAALTQKMGDQLSPNAAAAQDAARDQCANELAGFVALVIVGFVFVALFPAGFPLFSDQVGHQESTHTPIAERAAGE